MVEGEIGLLVWKVVQHGRGMDYSSSRAIRQAFTLLSEDEADWSQPIAVFFFFTSKGESRKTGLHIVQCLFYKQYRAGPTLGRYLLIFLCSMTDMAEL